jgi:predicted RNase H-like nuclease
MPGPLARSPLPYNILAGVEPVTGGWLVVPGNLQGVNLMPQPAFVLATLTEVLDYRPSFSIVALHSPIGFMDKAGEVRTCDLRARELLGPRAAAIVLAPSRELLQARSFEEAQAIEPGIDIARWRSLRKTAEAAREVQSWNQRTVFEVHPELGFFHMNGDKPVPFGRSSMLGLAEREQLVCRSLPGAERVLRERPRGVREAKLVDALADLWTARRIAAHAITRTSPEPTWDSEGLRMDIVY